MLIFCEINMKAFFVSVSLVRENLREFRENKKHMIRISAVSQNGSAVEDGFEWEWIFGHSVKAISSPAVRSPWWYLLFKMLMCHSLLVLCLTLNDAGFLVS